MNYWVRIFISSFFFLSFFLVRAQNNNLYNLKLKSGLIIKCELISFLPDSTVSIRQYGMVSTINCNEIISIEQSGFKVSDSFRRNTMVYHAPVKPKPVFRNLPENVWTCGIQLCLNINEGAPYGETSGTSVKLSTLTGLNKHLEVGFCTGLDYYTEDDWLLGIAAGQARYCILANRYKTPMIYTQLGYGFNFFNGNPAQYGGINFATGIGMSSRTKSQDIFCVMVGFKLQKLKVDQIYRTWGQNTAFIQTYTLMGLEAKVEWRF